MARNPWRIEMHPRHKRWYLTVPAGTPADRYPTVEEIRQAALGEGIEARMLLREESLQRYLDRALETTGEEASFPIVIEPNFDARITISPDKTAARLYLRKASAPAAALDMKIIGNAISNSRIQGLDLARVKADIEAFRQSADMELSDYLLAEGTPPGRGPDRELVPLVEWLPEEKRDEIAPRIIALIAAQGPAAMPKLEPSALKIAPVEKDAIALSFTPAEFGTPGMDVHGKEIPGLPGNDPFIQSLYGAALGPQGVKADKSGMLALFEENGVFRVWVFPYADARATVTVTPDDMLATIILESEEGIGLPLTLELARSAIEAKGIKGGISDGEILKAIKEAQSSKSKRELTLARGKPAVPAGSPDITWTLQFSASQTSVSVLKDQEILSWKVAAANQDGVNVFGAVLKASEAAKLDLPGHDDTVRTEAGADGRDRMITNRPGELTFREGVLSVSGTRKLERDIDESSGDIAFPGDLELVGNVASGRSVRAEGSLTMKGSAGASLLAANGVVFIDGGIKGGGSGTVWSKQTIDLTFAENARILAGYDISIERYCFQCVIKTNGKLLMKGNPGALLGGSIQASKGVEVFELGSSKTIRTTISFGQNYLVRDQINVCEKEALSIKDTVKRIDAQMAKLTNQDPRIHELRQKKLELLKRNDKLTLRIFTLKEQFEAHIVSSIRVENTVWPGVVLESHGRYYEVRERRNHVVFIFDQATGQITCTPISEVEEL